MKHKLIDLLLVLTCIALVSLAFLALLNARVAEQEDVLDTTEAVSEPSTDVVLMVTLTPTEAPEPAATPEPTPYPCLRRL